MHSNIKVAGHFLKRDENDAKHVLLHVFRVQDKTARYQSFHVNTYKNPVQHTKYSEWISEFQYASFEGDSLYPKY
jgi:hypothetical protein